MASNKHYLLGYASGLAGADPHTGDGPLVIQQSSLITDPESYQWTAMIRSEHSASLPLPEVVGETCSRLARAVSDLTSKQKPFTVIGGDHSGAIGTWSGVYDALHQKGDIGLIWIDAHMDSHTPETSLSGRIHGMPLACLLGYGYPSLTNILHESPKIKPENICLIGVRSFETGESELLAKLNVRVYFIEEVKQRGISTVLQEAVKQVSANTIGYGISLDLDSIDPSESPGVDVPEMNGIDDIALSKALMEILPDPNLIGTEIVEFDPLRDQYRMTEKLIVSLMDILRGYKGA